MRRFTSSVILLAILSPTAFAQSDDADVALYRKLIDEARQVNAALTASNGSLAKSLEEYRREIRLLRGDRAKFVAERESLAKRVAELRTQLAKLQREASVLYRHNMQYVQEYARIQREWTTDRRPSQNGTSP